MTQFRNGPCTACVDTRICDRLFGLVNYWASSQQPGSGTFGLLSCPQQEKTYSCQAIQIICRCQAWSANMAAWSGSHLLSTGVWEMDFVPRQVSQQIRWLCGKISEVKCSKWIKSHLTLWGYLVAIKWGTLLSDFPSYLRLNTGSFESKHNYLKLLSLFNLTTCFGLCTGPSSGHKIYRVYSKWLSVF